MAYSDALRTPATYTGSNVADLIDGVFGASGALGASSSWSPTHTGFSANPTNVVARYWRIGKLVICSYSAVAGTSNTTGYTITLPVTAATITNAVWAVRLATVFDNSAYSTSPGIAQVVSAGTTAQLLFNQNGSTLWTGSGTKLGIFSGLIYEGV